MGAVAQWLGQGYPPFYDVAVCSHDVPGLTLTYIAKPQIQ